MAIDPFFGSVLAAGTNVLGGILGAESSRKANENARQEAVHNRNAQLLYAQHGLGWRARDAMEAYSATGIHPLAMLGVQGPTYSPVSSVFSPSPMGGALASAGQDISRGIHASADRELRQRALDLQMATLNTQAEKGTLENELLKLKIASDVMRLRQMTTPGIAGDARSEIGNPGSERKIIPDVSVARTPRGGFVLLPSEQAQQRMEEITGLGTEWFSRNRVHLLDSDIRRIISTMLPRARENMHWRYNAGTGEFLEEYDVIPDRHLPRPAARVHMRLRGRGWRE